MTTNQDAYITDEASGSAWDFWLGDSCERMAEIGDETVGLSVHSPPFAQLFLYSPSDRDLGNCADRDTFRTHYGYVIRELLRVTQPGRVAAVHIMDLATTKATHGQVGLTDFSGQVIEDYIAAGWIYIARVTIRKSPQAVATRTKAHGLMFVTLNRDSSQSRPVHPDYLLIFRKPGDNAVPVKSDVDHETWIKWAEAIWDDIRETDTLNFRTAREEADERHICPLALPLIERCVRLWSNPGELVFSPFGGIGSEPFTAVKFGRRALAIELRASYWATGVKHLRDLDADMSAPNLFDTEDTV